MTDQEILSEAPIDAKFLPAAVTEQKVWLDDCGDLHWRFSLSDSSIDAHSVSEEIQKLRSPERLESFKAGMAALLRIQHGGAK